ncbi:thrombospondin-2-like [Mercenaria mercenaria]|uniref:thrombospondin-2-like n=1 Tax=Mercenaria mercenaria TaxID=6596 RepID=UPI00234F6017|nr:thrombospondin-2-like [Mercenaria mercenaria]
MLFLLFILTIFFVICPLSGQRGPVCYSCQSINDVSECAVVDKCGVEQVCFVETDPNNNSKRNLGCQDIGVCRNFTTSSTCSSCCHGDLCNDKGCEIKEIPNQHGPLCYTCQGQETTNDCSKIKQCSLGEVCILSRIRTGNNITYDSNCVNNYYCPTEEIYAVGKREVELINERSGSTTECQRCCSGDVCNDIDCTNIHATNNPTQPVTTTMQISTIPQPVDGKFGDWSSWTRCPFSCGRDGIQHRFRHCNNPAPQNGGNLCSGARIDTQFCHNAPCCTGPPVITFIDNDTLAHIGDFVKIHCNVSHADSVLWEGPKIVGHKFPENVEVIPGINELVFSNIAHNNTGPYRCVAQNACGVTSKYVHVGLLPQ